MEDISIGAEDNPFYLPFQEERPFHHSPFEVHYVEKFKRYAEQISAVEVLADCAVADVSIKGTASEAPKMLYLGPHHLAIHWKLVKSDELGKSNFQRCMRGPSENVPGAYFEGLAEVQEVARNKLLVNQEGDNWVWYVIVFPSHIHLLNSGLEANRPQTQKWNGVDATVVKPRSWVAFATSTDSTGNKVVRQFTKIMWLIKVQMDEANNFFELPEQQSAFDQFESDMRASLAGITGQLAVLSIVSLLGCHSYADTPFLSFLSLDRE